MARNSISISAPPEDVFDVLEDAYAYPRWVVGTRRVRRVDPGWPAVGSHFHHAIGTAAGELHDSSKVIEHDRPRRMALEVRFRPAGIAAVEVDVASDGAGSIVSLTESPMRGLAARVPSIVMEPLLWARNALALQRLRHEVERTHDAGSR
jgi:uncharacterized protein YndB with AHSA1/START domain